jgi:hypothetical protein
MGGNLGSMPGKDFDFGEKTEREHSEDIAVDGRIILKLI